MSQTAWQEHLRADHEITERVIAALEKAFAGEAAPSASTVSAMLDYFGTYVDKCHNIKEEMCLFPLVEKLGIPRHGGPLAVMLGEHEQARALVAKLVALGKEFVSGNHSRLSELRNVFTEYAELLKAHFWKENDILYPMAQRLMSAAEDQAVADGILKVEAEVGADAHKRFYDLANQLIQSQSLEDLSFGLSRDVLAAMLNTLPIELSFVDANDTVRYFSHENLPKIFGRTRGAIGTHVEDCHPAHSVHMVKQILADFKTGKRDVAEFWIDLGERKVHIRYWPVRDAGGAYLGCMEAVQDITAIQKLSGQKRLLD